MSLVSDHVRHLDAYLDHRPVLAELCEDNVADEDRVAVADAFAGPRLNHLLRIVQALSATSTRPLLSSDRVRSLLVQSDILQAKQVAVEVDVDVDVDASTLAPDNIIVCEDEVEWLLVTKAAIQVYGIVLNTLLDRIVPISDDTSYWTDVLNSYAYSGLYTVQTSPFRWLAWTEEIYKASKDRLQSLSVRDVPENLVGTTASRLTQQWTRFYDIVRESVRERSVMQIQRKVLSPVAYCRSEARKKQLELKKLKETLASGLGALMYEGMQLGQEDDNGKVDVRNYRAFRDDVERSVALMDVVLKEVCNPTRSIDDFEDSIFARIDEDPEFSASQDSAGQMGRPAIIARRLLRIIDHTLPAHLAAMRTQIQANGKPPPLVRYWLPCSLALFSSTTLLRILVHRKADIVQWVADLGVTVRDFWYNWVVEPGQKVVKTIRHDANSEIAIMSRDSLRADRASLERMVVDFAVDKPHFAVGAPSISSADIAQLRARVAEGDVTPVLRAYEQDLRRPFFGALRGDLVRSLLIQVQKTKVDLEVAMTGIDSLLKSQELVFGFVGLTPGVLVSFSVLQYLRRAFGGRTGRSKGDKAVRAVRVLRNIDRILADLPHVTRSSLPYKDYGLLLCEVHVLRGLMSELLPASVEKDFLQDLDDLAKIRGSGSQAEALERIRWAYGRWLQ